MKQIVDKLNKIAKKINENVELSDRDLIIDSLDSITKAYGGTPNDSNLIVDKLEDIYNNISPAVSGNIEITENGENINVAPYATATVNVSGGGDTEVPMCAVTVINDTESDYTATPHIDENYYYSDSLVIPAGGSAIVNCLYQDLTEFMGNYFVLIGSLGSNMAPMIIRESDISNMVNITLAPGPEEGTYGITPTDHTKPSSCTLPVSIVMPK